ncbi:MAG: capsular polysaccharide synthesis protein [Rickettsiales bacterium]|jgi:hypothetical protein|nr:capsular polysaccharide synthesis protein [Rickettsiales bacterium]
MFGRTFAIAEILLRGHIGNPFWWPRMRRRAYRRDITAIVIPEYMKKYVPQNGTIPVLQTIKNKDEKIFSIWQQGVENAPPIVRACFDSMQRNCNQELLVLTDKTLSDYIDLPGVIMDKRKQGKIGNAHFSDICRVELLYNYGGIWMDGTNFATGPVPTDIMNLDFFVYMADDSGSRYSFIQNCFIRARKNSYLLAAWREMILEFWKNEPREFDYFMHQLMFKSLVKYDAEAKKLFNNMPHIMQEPTHRLWAKYAGKPFDADEFTKITGDAFFQKVTYRGRDATNPVPGSFSDYLINMGNK